jgi:hypothetical protein
MVADLEKLVRLINREEVLRRNIETEIVQEVDYRGDRFPIYCFKIGTKKTNAPVLFITGGVHGLERIGAQLAWSLLKTTIDRYLWDKALQELLSHIRLVVMPLINPVGYKHFMRSNGRGVDLMRNSPINAKEPTPFMLGGQSYSASLPWYRGSSEALEPESEALIKTFKLEAFESPCVISVDFHSGFGLKDRLWFPFSFTETLFDHFSEMHALANLFEQTHPYHIYKIEPQSKGYLLNGDLWDFLYLEYLKQNKLGVFIPLTLEMGSWSWVRKNPLQLFSKHGAFNPIKEHRIKRTYRRHHLLFDFLLKAVNSNEIWAKLDEQNKAHHRNLGLEKWYK